MSSEEKFWKLLMKIFRFFFRIPKIGNFRPISKQWSPKWGVVKRSLTRQSNKNCGSGGQPHHQFSTQGGGKTQGKIKLKHKWRWDAAGAYLTVISVIDWWLLAAGGWLTWRGVFLRWTPLGFCLFAATQWHLHNREQDRKGLPRTASQWQVIFTAVRISLNFSI
jgi:hypothetical protein